MASTSSRTALVTGASGGLGLELARLLGAKGFDLVLVARSEDKLERAADEFRRKKVTVRTMVVDLADPIGPDTVWARLGEENKRVDVLINNAGFAQFGEFTATDPNAELQMMQLNMVTLTRMTKLVLPSMLSRGSGRIMNMASTAAFQPGPLMAVYYATKAYVLSFSEALAEELRGTGVTVTAFAPGPTRTGFQERAAMQESRLVQGRIADARTVAQAGFDGLMAGKRVVVPGIKNKFFAQSVRLTPRAVMTRLVKRLQERH